MAIINVSDEIFEELLNEVNTCKRWGFYNLDNQYKFVEKVLIKWCSMYHIDDNVQKIIMTNAQDIFKSNYCMVDESNRVIEVNDKDTINKYYRNKGYTFIQLTLPDRIDKFKTYLISKRV